MIPTKEEIADKVKVIIAERLNLGLSPDQIGNDQVLFGPSEAGGLGLDSIEALEIVVALEDAFGIHIENDEGIESRFQSVNTLSDYVIELLQDKASEEA